MSDEDLNCEGEFSDLLNTGRDTFARLFEHSSPDEVVLSREMFGIPPEAICLDYVRVEKKTFDQLTQQARFFNLRLGEFVLGANFHPLFEPAETATLLGIPEEELSVFAETIYVNDLYHQLPLDSLATFYAHTGVPELLAQWRMETIDTSLFSRFMNLRKNPSQPFGKRAQEQYCEINAKKEKEIRMLYKNRVARTEFARFRMEKEQAFLLEDEPELIIKYELLKPEEVFNLLKDKEKKVALAFGGYVPAALALDYWEWDGSSYKDKNLLKRLEQLTLKQYIPARFM